MIRERYLGVYRPHTKFWPVRVSYGAECRKRGTQARKYILIGFLSSSHWSWWQRWCCNTHRRFLSTVRSQDQQLGIHSPVRIVFCSPCIEIWHGLQERLILSDSSWTALNFLEHDCIMLVSETRQWYNRIIQDEVIVYFLWISSYVGLRMHDWTD